MIGLARVESRFIVKKICVIVMTQKNHTISGGACTRMCYAFARPPNLTGRRRAYDHPRVVGEGVGRVGGLHYPSPIYTHNYRHLLYRHRPR